MLVSLDWLVAVRTWLLWARASITDRERQADLDELARMALAAMAESPLIYLRRDDPSIPAWDPAEQGH